MLDTTLGNANSGPLTHDSNGVYTITPSDGKQTGGNLFFSFGSFNLAQGETASFSLGGTLPKTAVQTVVARVTGMSPSSIDGTLQCTIRDADLYLINPNGVVFGANARLDLQGSFAVTTANAITLGTGGSFDATTPSSTLLTADPPAAFGFTSHSTPAAISFTGTQFSAPIGTTLALAGGAVNLSGATLQASAGRISITSAGAAGQVSIDPATLDLTPSASSGVLGPVSLTANSLLSADGPTGGAIHIAAASLILDQSSIHSATRATGAGAPITISLTGPLTVNNGSITAGTTGPGAGGNITVSAGAVVMTGGSAFTGVDDSSNSAGAGGPAGNISITAGSLQLLQGAAIQSLTYGLGKGGDVTVKVSGAAVISGENAVIDDSGIYAQTTAGGQGGDAGNITLTAASLQLQGGGSINSATFGRGHGGNIAVSVSGPVLISGEDSTAFDSGIYAPSNAFGQGGSAGNITLTAANLTMQGAGRSIPQRRDSEKAGISW